MRQLFLGSEILTFSLKLEKVKGLEIRKTLLLLSGKTDLGSFGLLVVSQRWFWLWRGLGFSRC